ncbi:hypothetical protein D9619_009391 [Psilocybe cf. subviscida]|uniref:MARVEL domain-containing protein n=1 Tax=Psilocybe cf. subviscida TaxID=2480587 RepID=A0A8H5BTK2_9AGAR|nr:hypothetical protein D9619_009391 [Psilocybe cf. subviscida]
MWPLWIMLLVGAAVMTSKWSNLKWCRGSYRACKILETIKAFSWITWGILTLALLASIIHMLTNKRTITGGMHGEEDGYRAGAYPETRQTTSGAYQPETRQATSGTYQPETHQTTTVNTTRTRPIGTTDANVQAAAVA